MKPADEDETNQQDQADVQTTDSEINVQTANEVDVKDETDVGDIVSDKLDAADDVKVEISAKIDEDDDVGISTASDETALVKESVEEKCLSPKPSEGEN